MLWLKAQRWKAWRILPVVGWGLLFGLWLTGLPAPAQEGKVLSAGVSKQYILPRGMYGLWSVQAQLVDSSRPDLFPPVVTDLWLIQQAKQTVTLTNPSTGASATIKVEEVTNNSARFYHVASGARQTFIERPAVTVANNQLVGTTTIERLITPRQGQSRRFSATYKLVATRLNDASTVINTSAARPAPSPYLAPMGQAPANTDAPSFYVAPLQKEGDPLPW